MLWFIIDKHPSSLGTMVPGEFNNLLDNFQLAFDMLKAGFVKASFVFIWKSHYIVLSIIAGLLSSILFQGVSNIMRRRKLHEVMWPKKINADKVDNTDSDESA